MKEYYFQGEKDLDRKRGNARNIADIIPDVFRKMGLSGRMEEGDLVREWEEIAGEQIAKRSSVFDLREGILYVKARNNLWMQEIRFMQNEIISRIKERFPGLEINGIRTVIEKEKGEG